MNSLAGQKGKRKSWRNSQNNNKEISFILWGVPLGMVFVSSVLIASTQRQANFADWQNHTTTACIGVFIALCLERVPIQRLRSLLFPIYLITVFSLIAVQFVGVSALGSQRWLNVGGLNIQPSEFAKLAAIMLLASILERYPVERPVDLLRPLAVICVPWALVFVQPDLGTSLVFGAVLLVMLYWSGMPLEWVFLVISLLVTAVLVGVLPWSLILWVPLMGFLAYRSFPWKKLATLFTISLQTFIVFITPWFWKFGLKDYQRDRLVLFIDPSKDPLGGGYHLLQSTVGIGSGGFWGTGLLQGQLTKLRFIPEQHTDFIFSALGEEAGFCGSILVVFGFSLLMFRLLTLAQEARTDFESLLVVGVLTMLVFQVVVNIFMTIGLGPVTGIPLPFMSYGRSALIVNFAGLGLCLSVARRSLKKLKTGE